MQIIPTTGLKKLFPEVEAEIQKLKEASRWVQIDVCDGVFTTGRTFDLDLMGKLDFETPNNLWDVHLMVKEPTTWVNKAIHIGASRIIGQVEMMSDRSEFLEKIKNEGAEAGLAFDVDTTIDKIEGDWDMVLLMGRKAGFGYFEFEKKVLDKIKEVKDMGYLVGIDGGADEKNIVAMEEAGADIVYSEVNYWKLRNDR